METQRQKQGRCRPVATLTALLLALGTAGCGPTGIVTGISELADNNSTNVVTVLVLVNNSGEPLQVDITGVDPDGGALPPQQVTVTAAGLTQVGVPRAAQLRVRGCEMLASTTRRPPVTWDFDVASPGAATTATFGVESVVVGARNASGSDPDRIELNRLDSDTNQTQFNFTQLQSTPFTVAPDRVELHPSGGYVYTLHDRGGNTGEIRAFRIDAESRAAQLIESEFGSTPANPMPFMYTVGIDKIDLVIDPLGRFAYLLDNDPANFRTQVLVFAIEADGSLRATDTFQRGLLTSLEFRPNGQFVYLYEDFGSGSNFLRAFRVDDATGAFGLLTGSAVTSCVNADEPQIAVHPNASYAYITVQDPGMTTVRVGTYFIGSGGDFVFLTARCDQFDVIRDLDFDPAGNFLYVTGVPDGGATEAVLRYPITQATGALGTLVTTQTVTAPTNITAGDNPGLATSNAFKNIVYVAIGDTLVPHTPDATTGALVPVPGAVLGFGSTSTTKLVSETRSGTVTVQAP